MKYNGIEINDDIIKKLSMDSITDGGGIAISGIIKAMKEYKENIGDDSLKVSEFINLLEEFKGNWRNSIFEEGDKK